VLSAYEIIDVPSGQHLIWLIDSASVVFTTAQGGYRRHEDPTISLCNRFILHKLHGLSFDPAAAKLMTERDMILFEGCVNATQSENDWV